VTLVPHPEVVGSAERLLEGLAGEFQRLRDGAALPALGEGRVCDFCEARGLCRRDHWLDENPDDKPD
jgi:ATP-dependent helicase/nuclease subunit B